MTGRLTFESVSWADAELEEISVDYDQVVISVTEPTHGDTRKIVCRGHIGFELLGFWDEAVVESVQVTDRHALLDRSLEKLNQHYPRGAPESGQPQRNLRTWSVLIVTLSDGAELRVAANEHLVE